jgi:membrane protease YdiL (CAAX protease family)
VLQFPLCRILLGGAAILAAALPIKLGAGAIGIDADGPVPAAVIAPIALLVYVAYVRGMEGRSVVELGRAGALRDLGAGFVFGLLLFSGTITVLWIVGACTIARGDGVLALATGLAVASMAAVVEEVLVRGLLYRILQESLGSFIALGLSATIFGLLHALNPGATAMSTAAIALEAGVLLGAAYLYSGRLWLPIGLHAAWNFAEGGLFGASVSGHEGHGFLTTSCHGADWLSGGDFGPEASIVPVVLCLTAGVWFLLLAHRQRRFVPPFWRR